ncbi:hypothetical protein [Corynebacterium ureicelerivorans]|uniref:hypothetical protein n=1 Tax=Corynebacterium ureicelerivorans TaxID=401472 RepID=UPI0023525812|nr:hypothetical protein [Corynebacterium ureicelerivorans]MDN8626867.1 hypothetical protein [Corynebacterium ureicelerivorans]
MTSTRIVATVAATAVALTSLTACSGADEAGNQSTAASTETVVSTETVTSEQTSAPAPAGVGVANTGELPRAVTGYTDEARAEMAEDGLAEADVQAVVDAAHAGDAEVEWDDDGYWELGWQGIDVDITPDGLVREADR